MWAASHSFHKNIDNAWFAVVTEQKHHRELKNITVGSTNQFVIRNDDVISPVHNGRLLYNTELVANACRPVCARRPWTPTHTARFTWPTWGPPVGPRWASYWARELRYQGGLPNCGVHHPWAYDRKIITKWEVNLSQHPSQKLCDREAIA